MSEKVGREVLVRGDAAMTTDELSAAILDRISDSWEVDFAGPWGGGNDPQGHYLRVPLRRKRPAPAPATGDGGRPAVEVANDIWLVLTPECNTRHEFLKVATPIIAAALAPASAPATGTEPNFARADLTNLVWRYVRDEDGTCRDCGAKSLEQHTKTCRVTSVAAALASPAGVTVTGDADWLLKVYDGVKHLWYGATREAGDGRPMSSEWVAARTSDLLNLMEVNDPRLAKSAPAPVEGAGAHTPEGCTVKKDGICRGIDGCPGCTWPYDPPMPAEAFDAPQAAAQPAPTVTPAAVREAIERASTIKTKSMAKQRALQAVCIAAEAYAAQQPQKGMIAVEMPLGLAKTFASNSPSPSGYDRSTDLLASACRKALAAQQQQSTQGEAG